MSNKYVCPKCGGQLKVWREDLITTEIDIDKETGKIIEKTVRHIYIPKAMDFASMSYECKQCGFDLAFDKEYKDIRDEISDELDEINADNDINKSEYTELIKNGKIKVEY